MTRSGLLALALSLVFVSDSFAQRRLSAMIPSVEESTDEMATRKPGAAGDKRQH